jgi:hypothetical protein
MKTHRSHPPRAPSVADELDFWSWFVSEGLRKWWNRWLLLHVGAGAAITYSVQEKLSYVGATVVVPLAGVLVGLAFAWAGNAMAILQSPEVHQVAESDAASRRYRSYVFTYQMAILAVLVVLVMWGLLAIGVANRWSALYGNAYLRFAGRTAAFAVSSVAIRECWHVVLGAQSMLLMRNLVRNAEGDASRREAR